VILMFKVIRSVVPTEWTNDNYRDPIVVNQLKKDFLSKCYLCEQTDFGNVNIEHFVPHLNQSEELLIGKIFIIHVPIVMGSKDLDIKNYLIVVMKIIM